MAQLFTTHTGKASAIIRRLLPVFLVAIANMAFAQISIKGTVSDSQNQPLGFVTIVIKQDSALIATTLSAKDGAFGFVLNAPGNYTLSASLINYQPLVQQLAAKEGVTVVLRMTRKTELLKGVTVTAKAPLIERRADRMILNVAQSISASGSTYWDVLSRSPGVTITNSGDIRVLGKSTLVLIDGRPAGVSGEDLAEWLRSKPADLIDKIEIFTNPPARFDAQGGTVINIITKKRQTTGRDLAFRSTYRQGYLARFSFGTAFNISTPKFRLSGNYGFSPSKVRGTEDEYVRYGTDPNYTYWNMGHVRRVKAESNDFGLSGEYQLNKKQVLGFKVDGFFRYNQGNRMVFTDVHNASALRDSSLITSNANSVKRNQFTANINYRILTDTTGGRLEADLNYNQYNARTAQYIYTQSYDAASQPKPVYFDARSNSDQQIRVKSAQLRYSKPFKGAALDLEAGIKITSSNTTNELDFTRRNGSGPYLDDPQRSNDFTYKEDIQAAYLSLNRHFPKTELQLGLRGELTQTKGISPTLQQVSTNNYFKLFPTFFLQHTFVPNKHAIGLQYGRRISRPDYWRLNPFQFYTTPYAYLQGNPFLQPAFLHNTELSYTYRNAYTFAVYFNYTDNPFTNITEQDNVNKLLLNTQVNLKNNIDYGAYFSASKALTSWWESTLFLLASHRVEKTKVISLGGQLVTLRAWTGNINTVNGFTLSKRKAIRAEITAWYNAPSIQGIYKLKSSNDISITLRKTLWKGKGTFAIGVQDLLFGNFYRITVNAPGQANGFSGRNDTRMYNLNFTYRFTKNKVTRIKDRKTGSEEEKVRLGNL